MKLSNNASIKNLACSVGLLLGTLSVAAQKKAKTIMVETADKALYTVKLTETQNPQAGDTISFGIVRIDSRCDMNNDRTPGKPSIPHKSLQTIGQEFTELRTNKDPTKLYFSQKNKIGNVLAGSFLVKTLTKKQQGTVVNKAND